MITIVKGQNRIIKLHFKNVDLTGKNVLVNIKGVNCELSKEIKLHDFALDGITHFVLTKEDTNNR
jgi:hypothetical protein